MAHDRKSPSRVLTASLLAALLGTLTGLIAVFALTGTAAARVVVLPSTAPGGSTQTFAVRLANERPDAATTRLELTVPADTVLARADVAPVDGWTSRVLMRPLDEPVRIADEEIDEAVDVIVWENGRVGRKQFAQFLLTVGPLPTSGRLALAAAQTYDDGTVDRWAAGVTESDPRAATAPVVTLVPQVATTPAGPPAAVAPDAAATGPGGTAEEPYDLVPLITVGGGVLLLGGVGLLELWSRRARRTAPGAADVPTRAQVATADRIAALARQPDTALAAVPPSTAPAADSAAGSGRHHLDPVPSDASAWPTFSLFTADDQPTVILDRVPARVPDVDTESNAEPDAENDTVQLPVVLRGAGR